MAAQNILTLEGVTAQLRETHGNLAGVARCFGVTRQAVWNYLQAHPELQEVAKECRECMKDHAESALYRGVLNGEGWAVCFLLKTQAKDRGYSERQEIATPPGQPLQAEVSLTAKQEYEQTTANLDELAKLEAHAKGNAPGVGEA